MAKRNNSVSYKGTLDVNTMTITEENKKGKFVYNILEAIQEYDGKETAFSLKEQKPVKPINAEANVGQE